MVFCLVETGCIKSSPNSNATSAICYVSVMNEAPYSSTADVYFNGTKVNSSGIAPGQFSSQYGSVVPGVYTVDFKVTGTDSLLYEIPAVQYDTANFYTLILYNTGPKSPAVSAARIIDDFSAITETSAYYRFFNLNPDIAEANLYLNGSAVQTDRTPLDFTNPSASAFQPVNPSGYAIQITNSATDSVLAALGATPLAAGSVYTIFLQGTGTQPTIGVLPAAY